MYSGYKTSRLTYVLNEFRNALRFCMFLTFSVLCILISLFESYNRYNILQNGISRTGVVTEIERETNADADISAITVRFNYDGADYFLVKDNKTLGLDNNYYLNESVAVKFLPASPEAAIIADLEERIYPMMVFGGIIFLAVLLYIVKSYRKRHLKEIHT